MCGWLSLAFKPVKNTMFSTEHVIQVLGSNFTAIFSQLVKLYQSDLENSLLCASFGTGFLYIMKWSAKQLSSFISDPVLARLNVRTCV